MELYYIYIFFIALLSSYLGDMDENFKGSSWKVRSFLMSSSLVGYVSYFALIIGMFFFVPWWHPILLFIGAYFVTGWIAGLTKGKHINNLLSIPLVVLIIILNCITWYQLTNFN
ncbi:MAG: hypothetical protein H6Q13_3343 [Bacteroidetes bacterium]|nr:hypothetical protein [Bacteroidota bacterium]